MLTASELEELRQALKLSTRSDAQAEDRDLFSALFACWCHNPVATFSLCLLAQAYDVSAELVKEVAEVEITVGFLMQVCVVCFVCVCARRFSPVWLFSSGCFIGWLIG